MKVSHSQRTISQVVLMEGARGCQVRWLVSPCDGAPNFAMRQFELAVGGHTPRHSHPYEHEVYVLEGTGAVLEDDREHPLRAGDFVFVAPNEIHQFRNTGPSPFRFLCLVPNGAATQSAAAPPPECGRPA